ncbi:MAG: DNA polymerase III subunit delta [Syntrophaceae bacterium]
MGKMQTDQQPAAVRLFMGEETFLMEEALSSLKTALGDEALTNFQTFNGDESIRVEDLLGLCNTLPFLGEKRLIILRNVQKLSSKALAQIGAYCRNPLETTTLVMTVEGQPPKSNDALFKHLPDTVLQRRFDPLKGPEIITWVQARAKARKKTIDKEAAALLAELTGGHTWFMASEIAKLCLYAGDRPSITAADVEYLVMKTAESSIFAFQDALFERRKEALARLSELEATGIEPLEVVAMLENHIIDHYKVLLGGGWKWRPIHPFVVKKITGRKSLWKAADLSALLSDIRAIERAVKTGRTAAPFAALTETTAKYVLRPTPPS